MLKVLAASGALAALLAATTMEDVTNALLAVIAALLIAIAAMIPYSVQIVKAWLRLKLTNIEHKINQVQATVDTNGAGVEEIE